VAQKKHACLEPDFFPRYGRRAFIEAQLLLKRNAVAIYQDPASGRLLRQRA
jgi:hypothetical protein